MTRERDAAERKMLLKPRRRRLRRLAAWSIGVVLVLVGAAYFATPPLASRFAPGIIRDAAAGAIAGPVEVTDLQVSWFGAQRVDVQVLDPADPSQTVIDAAVRVDRSLFQLIRSPGDIRATVEDAAVAVVREASGETNVQRALAPVGPPSNGPARLPTLELVVRTFHVRYADEGSGAAFEATGDAAVLLRGGTARVEANVAAKDAARDDALGTLTLTGDARDLTDADGVLKPEAAAGSVHLVSTLEAEALAGIHPALSEIGTLDVRATLADGVVTLTEPLTLNLAARAVLAPAVEAAAGAGYTLEFSTVPTLAVEVRTARLPLPDGAGGPVWAGAGVDATVRVGEARGQVVHGGTLPFHLTPGALRLQSTDIGAGVDAEGELQLRFAEHAPTVISLSGAAQLPAEGAASSALGARVVLDPVPTAIAGIVSEAAAAQARAWAGERLRVAVVLGEGRTPLGLDVKGQGLSLTAGIEPVEGGVNVPFLEATMAGLPAEQMARLAGDGPVRLAALEGLSLVGANVAVRSDGVARPWGSFDLRGTLGATVDRLVLEQTEVGEQWAMREVDVRLNRAADASDDEVLLGLESRGDITASGALAISRWQREGRLDPEGAVIEGEMVVAEAPVSLAGSLRDVITPVTGERLRVVITGTGDEKGALVRVTGGNGFSATTPVDFAGDALVAGPATVEGRVTPETVVAAGQRFAPEMSPAPKLEAPVRFTTTVQPVRLHFDEALRPVPRSMSSVYARTVLHDPLAVRDLPVGEGSDVPRHLGLRDGVIALDYGPNDRRRSEVSVRGDLFDPESGARLMDVDLLAGLFPGLKRGEFRAMRMDVAAVDAWLERDLLLPTLGDTLRMTAQVGQHPQADWFDVTAAAESPRLQGSGVVSVHPDHLSTAGIGATWVMTPAWFDRFGRGAASGVELAEPAQVVARVEELSLPREGERFAGDRFRVKATVNSPSLTLVQGDRRFVVDHLNVQAATTGETGGYDVRLWMDEPLDGPMPEGEGPLMSTSPELSGTGSIRSLHDASGRLTLDRMAVDLDATGRVETALVDALMNGRGLLVEALGPRTELAVETDEAGEMSIRLTTQRASVDASGAVRAGTFALESQSVALLSTVTPELTERLLQPLFPLLRSFEKTADNQPVRITTSGLTLPLNGDVAALKGAVTLDAGTMQFVAVDWIGPLLNLAGGRRAGALGGRVQPVTVTFEGGLAHIEAPRIGIGEVDLRLRGHVVLATRRADLVLYAPVEALNDELRRGLGSVAGGRSFVEVPIRIRGDLRRPSTELALDLLVQNSAGSILDQLIRGGLEDLFDSEEEKSGEGKKGGGGGKKKKNGAGG